MSRPLPSPGGQEPPNYIPREDVGRSPNQDAPVRRDGKVDQGPTAGGAQKPKKGTTPQWSDRTAEAQSLKILTVVDTYGWAYDEGCRGLYKILAQGHPEWLLDECLYGDVSGGAVDPRKYDVVFVWSWWSLQHGKMDVWVDLLEKLDPTKSIICIAGEECLNYIRGVYKHFNRFFYAAGNNQHITNTLREYFPYKTVFHLPFGVDLEKFEPGPPPKTFTVGWAGHQGRLIKRFNLAEEACKIAGLNLRLAGHITSGKYLPSEEMPAWYRDLSCLLITSETEAHPLVFYEAMACGRPVVSTLVGDVASIAKDGVNGFYLPVDSPAEEFAERLTRLKEDQGLVERMGAQARLDVEARWSWPSVVSHYNRAISMVCGDWSAAMLISRDDAQMKAAVESVLERKPSSFKAYVDAVVLPKHDEVCHWLEGRGIKVYLQKVTLCEDHHDDVTRAVHRAIIEADYPRVVWCDDDDLMLCDPRELTHLVGDGIGILYGDVEQRFSNGAKVIRHGAPIEDALGIPHKKGSVVIYNRDAVERVHRNIDVHKPVRGPRPRDYGYFWDYKIVYWLKRGGYITRYINQLLSVQNVNPNPGAKRKSLYEDWPDIVKRMDEEEYA